MGKTTTLTIMDQVVMLPDVHQLTSTELRSRPRTNLLMNPTAQILADFRSQVTQLLQERDKEWEVSRKLVEARQLTATLKRLIEEAHRVDLPVIIRDAITLGVGKLGSRTNSGSPRPPTQRTHRAPPDKSRAGPLCVVRRH